MSHSMLLGLFDWIGEFFQSLFDLIPKVIYLLYASLACLLDILQLALRKLAGLDVYYDSEGVAISGDIVTNFIAGMLGIRFDGGTHFDYSPLTTVFWSMMVFGVIICFVAIFVAIIKSHYNYDEKAAKGPMQYVYAGIKSIATMLSIPVIVVLGLFVSQAILRALDTITSVSSGQVEQMFDKNDLESVRTARSTAANAELTASDNEITYIFYDIFGMASGIKYGKKSTISELPTSPWHDERQLILVGSSNQTFSGALFKTAAYNANRVRTGQISLETGKEGGIYGLEDDGLFKKVTTDDQLANAIDMAFACNIHLSESYLSNPAHQEVLYYKDGGARQWTSTRYFTNWLNKSAPAFSKFNVGAVWYYYNLWDFNFIVGFGALVVCFTLFVNIILGLITRIFMCLGLFLIAPPIIGIAPLDKGEAQKKWRENFMQQVLMAYGAIVGMNIFFIILPLMNQIYFFNIPVADYFMQTLVIIVGLITIKAFISTISGIIGGADANKVGDEAKGETLKTAFAGAAMTGKAVGMMGKTAKLGYNAGKGVVQGGIAVGKGFAALDAKRKANKKTGEEKDAIAAEKEARKAEKKARKEMEGQESYQNYASAHKEYEKADKKVEQLKKDKAAYDEKWSMLSTKEQNSKRYASLRRAREKNEKDLAEANLKRAQSGAEELRASMTLSTNEQYKKHKETQEGLTKAISARTKEEENRKNSDRAQYYNAKAEAWNLSAQKTLKESDKSYKKAGDAGTKLGKDALKMADKTFASDDKIKKALDDAFRNDIKKSKEQAKEAASLEREKDRDRKLKDINKQLEDLKELIKKNKPKGP